MTNDLFFLEYFVNPHHRIYWIYILSTLAIVVVYFFIYPEEKKINLSRKLWLHPSATLDYRYFAISFFIKTWLVIPILIGANDIALWIQTFLSEHLGFYINEELSYTEIMILFTITLFIVSDFTRYWLHRLMHTVPLLWKFHKVHHSAKVLTPITFYRVHPVENILFGFRFSLSAGIVTGIFIFFFGGLLGVMDILGVNVIVFVFNVLGANLRHSHIKLNYFKWIEKLFISPFQHQIHHSTTFYNTNFGGTLALWDLLFGTLKHSHEIQSMEFGLNKVEHNDILDLLLLRKKQW